MVSISDSWYLRIVLDQALSMIEELYGKDDVVRRVNCLRLRDCAQNGDQDTPQLLFFSASYAAQLKLRTVLLDSQPIIMLSSTETFVSVTRNPGGANGGI